MTATLSFTNDEIKETMENWFNDDYFGAYEVEEEPDCQIDIIEEIKNNASEIFDLSISDCDYIYDFTEVQEDLIYDIYLKKLEDRKPDPELLKAKEEINKIKEKYGVYFDVNGGDIFLTKDDKEIDL